MKLASDEGRAIAFVLGIIGLAIAARFATQPSAVDTPAAAEIVDASALEDSSESTLKATRARARPLAKNERVDVNVAPAAELDRLPGVGPGLAARIVEERERSGAFDSAADLRSVRGLGAVLLMRLEPHVAFGLAPGLPRRVALSSRGEGHGRTRAPEQKSVSQSGFLGNGGTTRIDLNTATAAELDALPGIGPALAQRIIAKRDSLNGFEKLEDLKTVRGIGSATLERLRPFLRS